ncbi:hypothetical protein EJ08DRAFT_702102 [Tothia fuscella]|uniref:EF-hand domain-containing protein n=1 Tax=Tothia fuscella TaxID=1048955 RepID=A0A9P4NHI8_9PEZI|nr:hypothetical protein EJ08DRAFT_702102 [Tothia fuscella]
MLAQHFITTLFVIASSIFTAVQAECCGSGKCIAWSNIPTRPGKPDRQICQRSQCDDGFVHGNFQCCGLRKCNIFCCNCDAVNGKVCRVAKSLLVQDEEVLKVESGEVEKAFSMSDEEMFGLANVGGTGNMTLEEFAGYFAKTADDLDLKAKFDAFDKNGDGFLQVDEMRLDDEVSAAGLDESEPFTEL